MRDLLQYSLSNLEKEFSSNQSSGLSEIHYQENLKKYGDNKIYNQIDLIKIIISQFNIFNLLLLGIAFFLYHYHEGHDYFFILSFVVIDVLLGTFQEYQAHKTVKLLKRLSSPETEVIRSGNDHKVPSDSLTSGDIVKLQSGDLVPADIKIISSNGLFADESLFSGTHQEVLKSETGKDLDSKILLAGSVITKGIALGMVVYTGKNTKSEALNLSQVLEEKTSYQKLAEKLSQLIFRIVVISLLLVLGINYFFEEHLVFQFDDFTKLLIFSITLGVTVIPEALPLIVTFSLSRGAMKLYKKKVIVKKLASIEDLGGIEVLCSDKTGTLTENDLEVSNVLNFIGNKFGTYLYLSTNKQRINEFDKAIHSYYKPRPKYKSLQSIPFNAEKKKSYELVEYQGENFLICKGSFDSYQNKFNLNKKEQHELFKFCTDEGKRGKRVLVVGASKVENLDKFDLESANIKAIGAVSFEDEIKFSTFEALKKAAELNVQVKILTGDSKETTFYVANKLGLCQAEQEIITGSDLEKLTGETLQNTVAKATVFCRVSPDQKLKIVQILQKKFRVGFLGEGVNDAEALKQANVGIVVNNASEVARSQADIILIQKNLEAIIEGILEGRKIYRNISKYIKISVSSNFGNFFAMLFATFFVPFLPLKPIHILLLHFISDIPLLALAGDRVDIEDLRKPSAENFKTLVSFMIIFGGISAIFDIIIFNYFKIFGETTLQTSWFLASVLTEILIIFSLRTNKPFWKSRTMAKSIGFLSIIVILTTLMFVYLPALSIYFNFQPLTYENLFTVLIICFGYFITTEIVKNYFVASKPNLSSSNQPIHV